MEERLAVTEQRLAATEQRLAATEQRLADLIEDLVSEEEKKNDISEKSVIREEIR